jgi:hypothetical protein
MKKLMLVSLLIVAACSKSGDSIPAGGGLPLPKPTPPKDGGDGKTNPLPDPNMPKPNPNPPAPPANPKDPWPTNPNPPAPPAPNQPKIQANVVWDCKSEKTGSSVQINGYINDIDRRVYLHVKDSTPVLIKQDQYYSSSDADRYCLQENNGEKTEFVLDIKAPLTTTNKTAPAILTHYRHISNFADCGKIDSSSEFDVRVGLTCTRSDSAFINPDSSQNPTPVNMLSANEWPQKNWLPTVRAATKSISGYTYLLVSRVALQGEKNSPTILRLNRDLSRDTSFGNAGAMQPTLPQFEMGSDTGFEPYAIVPDASDGFFIYGRLDQTSDLFVAHFGANGQLKKDFLPSGFARITNFTEGKFYRFAVFTGQALVVSWAGNYAVVDAQGVNINKGDAGYAILDLAVNHSAEPQVFVTYRSTSAGLSVRRLTKSGSPLGYSPLDSVGKISRKNLPVLRTIPAPDNSYYIVMQEDSQYYIDGAVMHIRHADKNDRIDSRFDIKIQIPKDDASSFDSDYHDGRFGLLADNSLLVSNSWQGAISKTSQLGAIRIDTFGNMSHAIEPEFRSSIGMQGTAYYGGTAQVILQDESGQLYTVSTYADKDHSTRVLLLRLNKF